MFLVVLFLVSPCSLFAIERGNNDMFVFFLVALAICSFRHSGLMGLLLILSSFIFKDISSIFFFDLLGTETI